MSETETCPRCGSRPGQIELRDGEGARRNFGTWLTCSTCGNEWPEPELEWSKPEITALVEKHRTLLDFLADK